MNRKTDKPIGLYLLLIIALWAFCFVTLKLILLPYSEAYAQTGKITAGYLIYAAIGLLFSTPAPFVSMLIIAVVREKISLKDFFGRIFRTERKLRSVLLTSVFCIGALIYALLCGSRNGSPLYMLPAGLIVMIPFVGIAEETGWRGFLQPALEERFRFPFSVLLTGAVWYIWHLDLWLDPTSNHYGDSLIGFGITVFIWAFALAALYKATKSVIACAVYHAFIDAIGAVYDWNLLFDPFPGGIAVNIYRILWLAASVALWIWADRNEKQNVCKSANRAPDA